MPDKILFLITVDRLAPVDLSCYGNREVQMPCFDAMVLEGVVYDEHFAPATFPHASLNAWATGHPTRQLSEQAITEPEPALTDELMETLTSKEIYVSQINYPDNNYDEQIQQFFGSIKNQDRCFCWLRLSSSTDASAFERAGQLENVIAKLQESVKEFQDRSIAWLITSEQGQVPEEELPEKISALYATQLQQSLSRKLWRPLILSGNFLSDDCPQRIQSLTVAQDVHRTILEYLDFETPSGSTIQTLFTFFSQQQQEDRQLLLLDETLAGLRTWTDLTVIPICPHKETLSQSARYYLKPEDRNDVNDLNTTAPEHVDKRVAALEEMLNEIRP